MMEQAYADFATGFAADSNHPDLYCHRGQLHILKNEFSQAVSDLRDAVRLDPQSILAHVHLGMGLLRNNQHTEANDAFEKALALFPSSPDVHNYYGEFLLETSKLEEATRMLDRAVELGGANFAPGVVNQAVLKMVQSDMPGAMEFLKKAIQMDPLCETAHVHLAHLYIQDKDLKSAVESYDKAIDLLRVPQELSDCIAMREAVSAQLSLLEGNKALFEPIFDNIRRQMQAMQ